MINSDQKKTMTAEDSRENRENRAKRLIAVNIQWDTDEEDDIDLPKEVVIPEDITDEVEISDYLSDLIGFCHKGFGLEEI